MRISRHPRAGPRGRADASGRSSRVRCATISASVVARSMSLNQAFMALRSGGMQLMGASIHQHPVPADRDRRRGADSACDRYNVARCPPPSPSTPTSPSCASRSSTRAPSPSRPRSRRSSKRARGRDRVASPPDERVVLDAEDGLALVLFGDPARALDVAQVLQRRTGDAPLQVGLNYGPLALTVARRRRARVRRRARRRGRGGALRHAPSASSSPRTSRARCARRDPDARRELATAGDFTDTRVRLHSFYTPRPGAARARVPPPDARPTAWPAWSRSCSLGVAARAKLPSALPAAARRW